MAVIVASGIPSVKLVGGREMEITPFVGSDRSGQFCSFGVGYKTAARKASLWGLIGPHLLIQSWRAMRLLEKVPIVSSGTLCYCWYAASKEVHRMDQGRLGALSAEFPSHEEFMRARAEVLIAAPSQDEIESMLRVIRDNAIDLPNWELENIHTIASRPIQPVRDMLDALYAENERWAREHAERMAAAAQEEAQSQVASAVPSTKRSWLYHMSA